MYYALFDFEFEKDTFMSNPLHYKLGLQSLCYGKMMFTKWVIYGLWHSFVIYMICFQAVGTIGQYQTDGQDIGFYVLGHVVYGVCVIVANVVMLHKFNNYTGWGEVLVALMILSFFSTYFVESLMDMFPQVYLLFAPTFTQPMVWAAVTLSIIQTSIGEFLISRYTSLIKNKESDQNNSNQDTDEKPLMPHQQSAIQAQDDEEWPID